MTTVPETLQTSSKIKSVYQSSLVQSLSHRRSRRFSLGGSLTCGSSEYSSVRQPVPLAKDELALLCWAAAGSTGLVLSDIDSKLGCSTQVRHPGWTHPSPCNSHTTRLLFMNDDGVFLYRPRQATKPVHIENENDLAALVDSFDEDVIRLQDKRVDIPESGYVRLNMPSSNRPGQTLFMPVVNPNYEIINSLFVMVQYEHYKIVDDVTGKAAGIDKWVDRLKLTKAAPLSYFMNLCVNAISFEAAFMTQNLLLMAETLGLGAFPHAGYVPIIIMGGTPMTRGLGFRFTTDKLGMPNPVGLDGITELQGMCPPYYKSMGDAVQAVYDSKYGPGAIFSPENPVSPFLDQRAFAEGMDTVPSEVVDCIKDLCNYAYDKFGRFPTAYDTLSIPVYVGVHHVDLDFYAKFYQDSLISDTVRHHMANWHE